MGITLMRFAPTPKATAASVQRLRCYGDHPIGTAVIMIGTAPADGPPHQMQCSELVSVSDHYSYVPVPISATEQATNWRMDLLLAALALVLGFFLFLSVVESWRRLHRH
jgi:hypothetical protein